MDNDLLIRYLEGSCSEDDKVEVTKWIEEDPENLKNYFRYLHYCSKIDSYSEY
ncbi:MAG: hypothetical protein ACOX5K_08330 [Bacteroidales bacterium]|jgi:hypothetical protein|nr:hypothetical protein [Bacteroidota bacterium]